MNERPDRVAESRLRSGRAVCLQGSPEAARHTTGWSTAVAPNYAQDELLAWRPHDEIRINGDESGRRGDPSSGWVRGCEFIARPVSLHKDQHDVSGKAGLPWPSLGNRFGIGVRSYAAIQESIRIDRLTFAYESSRLFSLYLFVILWSKIRKGCLVRSLDA